MAEDGWFESAYAAHGTSVYRYCLFRTDSRHDAEDIAAETWARYLRAGAAIPPERVKPWLLTVARNLCTDRQRKRRREVLGGEDASRGQPSRPEPAEERPWRDHEVWSAVRWLTPYQQQVVFLRVVEDLSFAEVARLTGVSEGNARVRFHRAAGALRRLLGEAGFAEGVRHAGP